MARKRKPWDMVQLKLRFPEELRRRLEQQATRHHTSLNSEIIQILEEAFRRSDVIQKHAEAIAEALGDQFVDAVVERAKEMERDDWEANDGNDERTEREGGDK
jgi:plasmid stability protein